MSVARYKKRPVNRLAHKGNGSSSSASVCGVVPVAAIGQVFSAGTYSTTTTILHKKNASHQTITYLLVCLFYMYVALSPLRRIIL